MVEAIWADFAALRFPEDAFSEDVEWYVAADEPDGGPEGTPARGLAEVRALLATFWETVADRRVAISEIRDAGDRVIVSWSGSGTGRVSGVPVEWSETHVYRLRDGKVTEVREYRDLAAALAALRPKT